MFLPRKAVDIAVGLRYVEQIIIEKIYKTVKSNIVLCFHT